MPAHRRRATSRHDTPRNMTSTTLRLVARGRKANRGLCRGTRSGTRPKSIWVVADAGNFAVHAHSRYIVQEENPDWVERAAIISTDLFTYILLRDTLFGGEPYCVQR